MINIDCENMSPELLTSEFRALSARLGQDPLQVQGPGGNTSIKNASVMWIKASGTELANAETQDIFVAVNRKAALAEAGGTTGDGSCKSTTLDPKVTLRPSIETTFHAALNHHVVAHTHSVATLTHAISPEGRKILLEKLKDLLVVSVPYAKPGLPLTGEILSRISPITKVIVLENHGLICCGASVQEVSDLLAEVEDRLAMPAAPSELSIPDTSPPPGYHWAPESWISHDIRACDLALSGSYYPDHVVFLGPALPSSHNEGNPAAILIKGEGVAIRVDVTRSQKAMLRCLSDVLSRLPDDWSAQAIGSDAEASLLNWDAEKYRQSLAKRT